MKTIPSLILTLLLSACSALAPEPTPTVVPTSTATPKPVKSLTPTASSTSALQPDTLEYLDEVVLILDDISKNSDEMDDLFYLAAVRNDYLDNEDWLKLANSTLDALLEGADKIDALDPVPAQAESAHEYFQLAAEELRLAVLYQYEVIDGDFESAFTVTEHMQLHIDYVRQAFREIEKIQ